MYYIYIYTICTYMYTYICIYINLPVNVIVGLAHPRSGVMYIYIYYT